MANPAQTPSLPRLDALFAADPDRVAHFSIDAHGILFDFSKTHLDSDIIAEMAKKLDSAGFAEKRDALFAGGIVNPTEGRPATHVAERGSGDGPQVEEATKLRSRMYALIDAVEAGAFGEISGILHMGIGGSLLGPALLVDALGRSSAAYRARFVANIDGGAFEDAVKDLDPEKTLVVAASKTFTTAETLGNLASAIEWLEGADVDDPYGRVIAVTASPEAAIKQGVDETRILPFNEGVGGRYSLWSSIGFTAALTLGVEAFDALHSGAHAMDEHFRTADVRSNAPVLAAFVDRFYTERAHAQTRGVFAYDERLRLLPSYLQQLEMESNGKSVTVDGKPVTHPTAPITWGEVGTDAQHAVFQLLHQGTILSPLEFVAVTEAGDEQDPERRKLLLLNAFAQAATLMKGYESDDPAKAEPGNRPSTTVLIDQLTPHALGALIAYYEQRVFTIAVLAGINPFDQFGVEYGKKVARALAAGDIGDVDPSTKALIAKAGLQG